MTQQENNPPEPTAKRCIPGRQMGKHLLITIAAAALLGLTFWLVWNWAGVPLFTFPPLTYGQSLGAIVMTGFLLRMGMLALGRHRGPHFHRITPNGCRPCRPSRDI